MSKPESYSITPREENEVRSIFKASNRVLGNFREWDRENKKESKRSALFKQGVGILIDMLLSYEELITKVKKLSLENEALKIMYGSVEQERKDQWAGSENMGKLLDRINELKKENESLKSQLKNK